MRPDDPLAQKEVVHPEDLKDLPLILPRRQMQMKLPTGSEHIIRS